MNQTYTTAVTLLALVEYLAILLNVGRARARYGVKAPAVIGNEQFERAYRVQMNTLEQMVFFLPSLWLCALLLSDKAAAAAGLVWVIGRAIYAVSYIRDPALRGPGMMVSMLAAMALFAGAAFGLLRTFL